MAFLNHTLCCLFCAGRGSGQEDSMAAQASNSRDKTITVMKSKWAKTKSASIISALGW